MTEQIVIILIVVAVLVVLDGLRRKFSERRDRVVIKLDKSLPRSDPDEDELFKSELPNGGARTLPRSGDASPSAKSAPKLKSLAKRREQVSPNTVPVLLDAVDLDEEQIEHTNVFADTSSTLAALDVDAASEVDGTMGMDEARMELELEEIIDGLDDDFSEPVNNLPAAGKRTVATDGLASWDKDMEGNQEDEGDDFDVLDDADEFDNEYDDEEDDDEFDNEYDDEEDDDEENDEDEDEDEDDLAGDFGDYEVDDEQYPAKQEAQTGRIEPTFGEENKRRSGFGAGFLSKIDQGELFREDSETIKESQVPAEEFLQEVIIINVMARPGTVFGGYELLPVLQLQGLRLGDMSIFHKHSGSNATGSVIFSMANMVKPGTFDLATMDTFTTPGVCFFLQLPNKFGNMACFDQMLTATNALKHSLDGELKDENRSVFTRQTIEHCRQRIRDFELKLLARK